MTKDTLVKGLEVFERMDTVTDNITALEKALENPDTSNLNGKSVVTPFRVGLSVEETKEFIIKKLENLRTEGANLAEEFKNL